MEKHDLTWQQRAACAEEVNQAPWFPTRFEQERDYALETCARCPVRRSCLAYALFHTETHGIWGGLTYKERQALVRSTRCPSCRQLIGRVAIAQALATGHEETFCRTCGARAPIRVPWLPASTQALLRAREAVRRAKASWTPSYI